MSQTFVAFAMLVGGALLGYSIRAVLFILRKNNLEQTVAERLMHAKQQAQKIIDEANEKSEQLIADMRTAEKEKEENFKSLEERILKREELTLERGRELDERASVLDEKTEKLLSDQKEAEDLLLKRQALLEEISGYDLQDARAALIKMAEEAYAQDLQVRRYKLDTQLEETLHDRAKDIITSVIQRLSVPTANELTTATVSIEDDVKGKIIGKEGRNIRTFERLAGVELLIDETPGAIVVSCFDPVRRAIAVHALEALIKDGRIQPAKIEEEIEKAREAINEIIKEKGAAAVYECGIFTFDPKLISILGRLHFRTSYGQNVLQHSIEMAHLAGMIADEVGADSYIAKAGALVHDIGKALDHEFEGTHIDIGVKVLRRFGTDERVITAMKSHHDDCPHESLEAVIVQTADMISGARPGARRDTAEAYLKRLKELEGLAGRFSGVEKAYALQAGREIRIFVQPEAISDFEARTLARNIAINIEQELRYPGQIKVTIIRETRITDYAR
ncbi:MAG TPA: ribonuclease Y [Candidatus Paceibacterota bacterium]|nr:ribonuclease Y [Candidatus Paceibacterota bacterium]